jgi:hypothetical protein
MMNELIISTIMQTKNHRRFQELLSEAASERRYRQQTPRRPKLWQWVTDQVIATGKQFEPRERGAIKPACACSKMA